MNARLLIATGCRTWSDFAAMCGCYLITAALAIALCWPEAWTW